MMSGDVMYATRCAMFYSISTFWTGEISASIDFMRETMKRMKCQDNLVGVTAILPVFRVASKMVGLNVEHDLAVGDEDSKEDDIVTTKTQNQVLANSFFGLYEALIFRNFVAAKQSAEIFYEAESESSMASPTFMRQL